MDKLLRKFKLISRDDLEFMTYRFNFNPLYQESGVEFYVHKSSVIGLEQTKNQRL